MAPSGDSLALSAMLDSTVSQECMQPARPFSAVIRFGVFEADVESGELRKNEFKVTMGNRQRFSPLVIAIKS